MANLNKALALEAARRLEPITWSDHVVAIMTQCGDELTDVGDPDFWFQGPGAALCDGRHHLRG
jgi:hypothetical protein